MIEHADPAFLSTKNRKLEKRKKMIDNRYPPHCRTQRNF